MGESEEVKQLSKPASISQEEEVTLMDWDNAIVREIKKDSSNKIVSLIGELHLEGSVKSTKLKLTSLADTNELVHLSLVEFDYLIKKKHAFYWKALQKLLLFLLIWTPFHTFILLHLSNAILQRVLWEHLRSRIYLSFIILYYFVFMYHTPVYSSVACKYTQYRYQICSLQSQTASCYLHVHYYYDYFIASNVTSGLQLVSINT